MLRPSLRVDERALEDVAVEVGLALVVRTVAQAHRAAAGVALEMVERRFVEVAFTADAVHELEGLRTLLDLFAQEAEESVAFARVPECGERVEHEARIADPAVAVIPVALAPDRLRQRSGHRRDTGSFRRIRHHLECQGAALDQRPVRSRVPGEADPFAPVRVRDAEGYVYGAAVDARLCRREHDEAAIAGNQP